MHNQQGVEGKSKKQRPYVKSQHMEYIIGILLYNSFIELSGLNL